MTDEQFIDQLAQAYKKQLDNFHGTLIVNPHQYKKFVDSASYLKNIVDEMGGKITDTHINPQELHGWFSIDVSMLDFQKKEIDKFVNMLQNVNVFSIEPTTSDMIRIGINVNDIFTKVD